MKKRWIIITTIILGMLALTGCAKTADEKQMQIDLENTQFDFLDENEIIKEFIVEKRQTDKEQKTDIIWCSVTTADEYVSYQKEVILTYGLYDKGWTLDDVSVNAFNQWIQTPLQGINETDITNSLKGQSVTVDSDQWLFSKNNITNISVKNHDTDLEAKTDVVTVNLTVDDVVEEVTGELTVNYVFDNGWKFKSMSINKEFVASVKPEAALTVTNEDLIAQISGQSFILEEKAEGVRVVLQAVQDMHTVHISNDEISDFVIKEQELLSKGTQQIYHCGCTVNKACAIFALEVEISYWRQSDKWVSKLRDISAKCDTLDIVGEWTGTYNDVPFGGEAVLHISDIDENGNITAIYSYTPSKENRYAQPGSYNVFGTINMLTLDMNLTAGDWIEEPSKKYSWTKGDIKAMLCVDESAIKGTAQEGNAFEVTR